MGNYIKIWYAVSKNIYGSQKKSLHICLYMFKFWYLSLYRRIKPTCLILIIAFKSNKLPENCYKPCMHICADCQHDFEFLITIILIIKLHGILIVIWAFSTRKSNRHVLAVVNLVIVKYEPSFLFQIAYIQHWPKINIHCNTGSKLFLLSGKTWDGILWDMMMGNYNENKSQVQRNTNNLE